MGALLLQARWGWGPGSSLSRVPSSHTSVLLQAKQSRPADVPRLQLSSGFIWDVGLESLTPALPPRRDSSDSEEDEKPQQTTVLYFAGTPWCPFPMSVLACGCHFWQGGVISDERVFIELGDCPADSWLLSQTCPGSEELMTHLFLPFIAKEEKQEGKGAGEAEGRERAVPHGGGADGPWATARVGR